MRTTIPTIKSLILVALPLLLLVFVVPVSWARLAPIYNPDPIKAPCKLSADKMKSAIRQALHGRGWTSNDLGPGHMEGKLFKRRHVAIIDIRYDAEQATIRYKSSENLNYEKSGEEELIHGNYNKWIRNIEHDLEVNLSRAC